MDELSTESQCAQNPALPPSLLPGGNGDVSTRNLLCQRRSCEQRQRDGEHKQVGKATVRAARDRHESLQAALEAADPLAIGPGAVRVDTQKG